MRKYLFFLLGLFVFLNSNAITVYFENTVNWEKVCIYTHTPEEQTGAWSGTAMSVKEGNLWVYQDDNSKTSTRVIFNNGSGGSGNQYPTEGGFGLVDGAVYDKTGKIADSYEAWKNGEVTTIEPWTIYLDASWNLAYAYLYKDGNGEYKSWKDSPAMTKNSDGLWALTIDDYIIDNTLVIFKDFTESGSNRNPEDNAAGITVKDGAVYNTSDRTYFDSVDAWKASQVETPDPIEVNYTKVSVKSSGSNNDWNDSSDYVEKTIGDSKIVTFENVEVGTGGNNGINVWLFEGTNQVPYEFSFNIATDFGQKKELTKRTSEGNSYIKFSDNAKLNLTFDFTEKVPTVTVTEVGGVVTPDPIEVNYTKVSVKSSGSNNDWNDSSDYVEKTIGDSKIVTFENVEVGTGGNNGINVWLFEGTNQVPYEFSFNIATDFGQKKELTKITSEGNSYIKFSDNAKLNLTFDFTEKVPTVTVTLLKDADFKYYHESGFDHHRMYSIAGEKQQGEAIIVTHAPEFGKDDDHYSKINATLESAGDLTFSDLNKAATVESFKAGENAGESELVLKAHTAGIYNLVIKHEEAIEGDGVRFTPSVVEIPVRVSPSIRGIGLGFNWKGYQITNDSELAIVTEELETWVEKDNLGNTLHEWDLDHVHLTAFEANPEGLEIWYKYDEPAVAAETEEIAPVAYIGENEPSALDVATEQNTHPSEMGYTQFTKYGNAPSLNRAKENGGLSFVIVQNNIIGQPEHVTLRANAGDINSDLTEVEAIEAAEDAEAVYYTLDGVRVANPEKGLYIVVKGGKAAKIYKTL